MKKPYAYNKTDGNHEQSLLKLSAWLLVVIATLFIAISLVWDIMRHKQEARHIARSQARAYIKKDQAFRFWAASHGGVYVPVDEHTPHNPYLAQIPDRDIKMLSGQEMTLMSPAYMVRQVNERFSELYGIASHVTSLKPLRPENAPDDWERMALEEFEQGLEEKEELTTIEGKTYLRFMQPMITRKGCLRCHGHQDYKENDVHGGISVSVPMTELYALAKKHSFSMIASHSALWVLMVLGISLGWRAISRTISNNRQIQRCYEAVVSTSMDGFWMIDMQGNIREVNQAYCQVVGYSQDELLNTNLHELEAIESNVEIAEHIKCIMQSGPDLFETRHQRKDGSMVDLEISTNYLDFDGGRIFAFFRDISDRKQAEERIRKQSEFLRSVIEALPHPFYVLDANDYTIKMANSAAGNSEAITESTTCHKLTHHDNTPCKEPDHVCPLREIKRTKEPFTVEHVHYDNEGKGRMYKVYAYPIFDETGNVGQVIEYSLDITDQKRAEQEREHLLRTLAMKNEELESIIWVSLHDLRNPLINIQGFSGELRDNCGQIEKIISQAELPEQSRHELLPILTERIPESLDFIYSAVSQIDRLQKGILRLCRLGQEEMSIKPVEMNDLIANVIESMQRQICESGVSVAVDELPECLADEEKLFEIFSNLLDNAIKYLVPDRPGKVHISGRKDNGMNIYCVEDNGVGIDSAHCEKVFEIFHRLDPGTSAEGEGLGLTIVRRLVDKQNGKVWVESEHGKGSRFFIALDPIRNERNKSAQEGNSCLPSLQ